MIVYLSLPKTLPSFFVYTFPLWFCYGDFLRILLGEALGRVGIIIFYFCMFFIEFIKNPFKSWLDLGLNAFFLTYPGDFSLLFFCF